MQQQFQQSKNNQSLTQKIIENQIEEIYNDLRSLGYHQFLKTQNCIGQKAQKILSIYFQATPSRFKLIQWLISLGFPEYKQEPQYNVPLSRNLSNTKKLMSSIWKMGLIPFSKHTKTMDYQKYIQGLLGYQNSVKLIFDLTKFARKSKHLQLKKAQMEQNQSTFGCCLNELFLNYQSLINCQYDPYGVIFPAAYSNVDQIEIDEKFSEIKEELRNNQIDHNQLINNCVDEDFQINKMFQNAQKFSQTFNEKYEQLINLIESLEQNPNNQIFFKRQTVNSNAYQKNEQQSFLQKRRLKISLNLCQKVKEVKRLKKIKQINHVIQTKHLRQQIQNMLNEANQNIVY